MKRHDEIRFLLSYPWVYCPPSPIPYPGNPPRLWTDSSNTLHRVSRHAFPASSFSPNLGFALQVDFLPWFLGPPWCHVLFPHRVLSPLHITKVKLYIILSCHQFIPDGRITQYSSSCYASFTPLLTRFQALLALFMELSPFSRAFFPRLD